MNSKRNNDGMCWKFDAGNDISDKNHELWN